MLLGITAYFAINAAAVAYPASAWRYVLFVIWLLVLMTAIVVFASPISRRTNAGTFAIAFVLTCFTYALGAWAEYDFPERAGSLKALGTFTPHMPHWYVMGFLLKLPRADLTSNQLDEFFGLNLIALVNTMMIAGILGGCLSLWYYRWQQRSEKRPMPKLPLES